MFGMVGQNGLRLEGLDNETDAGRDDRFTAGVDPAGDIGDKGVIPEGGQIVPLFVDDRQNLQILGIHRFQRIPERGGLRNRHVLGIQIVAHLREQIRKIGGRLDMEAVEDVLGLGGPRYSSA